MASADPGFRITRLQDQAFAQGATVNIQTAGQLPPKRVVHAVRFRLEVDLVQAGGATAQLGAVLPQLIQRVQIGRRIDMSGLALHFLNWAKCGLEDNLPAGFPAGAGTYSRAPEWAVTYMDPSAAAPFDDSVPTELFTDQILVSFGTTAIFAATAPTVTGTLITEILHGPALSTRRSATIPPSMILKVEDFSALQAVITKAGKWAYAVLFREVPNDAGGLTTAQITTLTTNIDGEPLFQNVRGVDPALAFNLARAAGVGLKVESQTLPLGGERIQDQPGTAAAAGQGVTMDFEPLLVPPRGYRKSQLPTAAAGFTANMTGTLGVYRIAYQLYEPRADASVGNAARKLGIPTGSFLPKTENGHPLTNPDVARYAPLTLKSS